MYRTLEEDENFHGWVLGTGYVSVSMIFNFTGYIIEKVLKAKKINLFLQGLLQRSKVLILLLMEQTYEVLMFILILNYYYDYSCSL